VPVINDNSPKESMWYLFFLTNRRRSGSRVTPSWSTTKLWGKKAPHTPKKEGDINT
jgi:hypothetical protein